MATVPKKQEEASGADLKKIWQAKKEAIELKDDFVEKYADKFDKAIEYLEESFENSIQYYGFSKIDFRKISSTNTLERWNKEVRRRSRTVGIFPSTESYLRLMTARLIEYNEDHLTGASYISADTLRKQKKLNGTRNRKRLDLHVFFQRNCEQLLTLSTSSIYIIILQMYFLISLFNLFFHANI